MNEGHLALDSVHEPDPESIAGSGFHCFQWDSARSAPEAEFWRAVHKRGLAPRLPQLQTMLECPLQPKTEDSRGELSSGHPQLVDEDHRFITGIDHRKMGRRMVFVVDVNGDPEEFRDLGQDRVLPSEGGSGCAQGTVTWDPRSGFGTVCPETGQLHAARGQIWRIRFGTFWESFSWRIASLHCMFLLALPQKRSRAGRLCGPDEAFTASAVVLMLPENSRSRR